MGRVFWREGAGEWAFSPLDVRLRNLLFKGDVLKIADMGQSRILVAGQTGMDTATNGGTQGWMSPEEIKWDQVCFSARTHDSRSGTGLRQTCALHPWGATPLEPDSLSVHRVAIARARRSVRASRATSIAPAPSCSTSSRAPTRAPHRQILMLARAHPATLKYPQLKRHPVVQNRNAG